VAAHLCKYPVCLSSAGVWLMPVSPRVRGCVSHLCSFEGKVKTMTKAEWPITKSSYGRSNDSTLRILLLRWLSRISTHTHTLFSNNNSTKTKGNSATGRGSSSRVMQTIRTAAMPSSIFSSQTRHQKRPQHSPHHPLPRPVKKKTLDVSLYPSFSPHRCLSSSNCGCDCCNCLLSRV
jgi:hypothetical protein